MNIVRKRLYSQVARIKRKVFEQTGEKIDFKVDYDKIALYLGLPDGNIEDFEIDHIVPLNYLNNGNPAMLEQAFHYSNLRWLEKSENRKKSAKLNSENEINLFNDLEAINKLP